jgi:hypothetical protein
MKINFTFCAITFLKTGKNIRQRAKKAKISTILTIVRLRGERWERTESFYIVDKFT